MNQFVKKILNSLKCPICSAPIDVISGNINGNFGCAMNQDHYTLLLNSWELPVKIQKEIVNIYDKTHKYAITKVHNTNNTTSTYIDVFDTDLENRVIFNFKAKKFVMDRDLFDFTNFDKDRALKRIKTLFTFN